MLVLATLADTFADELALIDDKLANALASAMEDYGEVSGNRSATHQTLCDAHATYLLDRAEAMRVYRLSLGVILDQYYLDRSAREASKSAGPCDTI